MVKTIKDIVTDSFWIMPATPNFVDNGIPYITSKNIKVGKIDFSKVQYISENDYNEISKNRPIMSNDLLISMIGTLGNIAIVREEDKPFYGQNMFLLRLNSDIVDLRYFYNFFNSDCINSYLQSKKNKSTQGYLKANHIEGLEIPIVSLQEQKRIACELDRVTNLINKRKEQLLKLDEIVKARFVELFGNILCDSDLPLVQLKELADIGSSKRIYANEYVESGVPFYRSKEIRELGTGLKPSVELFIKQERYDEIKVKYGVPKKGDILIAAIGATIGYSWIVDTDKPFYYKDGNLIILSTKNNVNPIFLNHTMGILIEDFKSKGVAGSAQLALTIEKLEKMMVINPNLELQNQFATFVEQTDKSKLEVQKSLEKLELLKKALMQKYFG